MHCTNFSEKWRRHMNLFTKFVNIFLVINVKHYFFVSVVIILDYRINVPIRKAVCILLSFDSVYMHVFGDDNTA